MFLDFGITVEEFALLNAVWAAAIVLLEVPSGALADLIGLAAIIGAFFAGIIFAEIPDAGTRSDCHAWGAHPVFHFYATVLGIRPAAPGFRRVNRRYRSRDSSRNAMLCVSISPISGLAKRVH